MGCCLQLISTLWLLEMKYSHADLSLSSTYQHRPGQYSCLQVSNWKTLEIPPSFLGRNGLCNVLRDALSSLCQGRFLLRSLAVLLWKNPGQLMPGRPTGEMEIRRLAVASWQHRDKDGARRGKLGEGSFDLGTSQTLLGVRRHQKY